MKLAQLFFTLFALHSAENSFAAITPQQLQQLASNTIQCTQKNDDSDITITFENCKKLSTSDATCEVIANTDSDTRKLTDIHTWNTEDDRNDPRITTLLEISDGNDASDDNIYSSLVYDRDALSIEKDGTGFFYHQRSDEFWTFLFPENDQMEFKNCSLTPKNN